MGSPVFARHVYRLQNAIVRELNNAHIFLEQVRPVLNQAKRDYESSEWKGDRRYYVPSAKAGKFAKRTDLELQEIYALNMRSGLYEAFLVSLVARFEWFLSEVLSAYFTQYPRRLTQRSSGIPGVERIEIALVLDSASRDEILQQTIASHVSSVLRHRPFIYLAYLSDLIDVKQEHCFGVFCEISATRDLLVHNSRVVNPLYVEKSRGHARAAVGDQVVVDREYFGQSIAAMKRLSGVVKRDVEAKFGAAREKA